MVSKESLNKHWKAMEWWKSQPEGAKIWCKMPEGHYPYYMQEWHLQSDPLWHTDAKYVINDEFSEIRKGIADGKKIEVYDAGEWQPIEMVFSKVPSDPNSDFFVGLLEYEWKPKQFRVAPEYKINVKRNDFMVVKFLSKDRFEVLFVFDKEKAKSEFQKEFTLGETYKVGDEVSFHNASKKYEWEDVAYDDKLNLWDGQPLLVSKFIGPSYFEVRYYDAEMKTLFSIDGCRGCEKLSKYDKYKTYPDLSDDWIIEGYKSLKF